VFTTLVAIVTANSTVYSRSFGAGLHEHGFVGSLQKLINFVFILHMRVTVVQQ